MQGQMFTIYQEPEFILSDEHLSYVFIWVDWHLSLSLNVHDFVLFKR